MRKLLFLLIVRVDICRYNLLGNIDWCDMFLERACNILWPSYDGESFADWLRS